MGIAAQPGAPTTLADLLRNFVQAFSDMGDNTPILVGAQYKDKPANRDRRVLIDPYMAGKLDADAREQGSVGRIVGKCEVRCRGEGGADDIARLDDAEKLVRRVWAVLRALAPGMVFEGGPLEDTSPIGTDGYGFELTFTFSYRFDVWHDPAFWDVQQTADTSAPTPEVPPGAPMNLDLTGSVMPGN